LLFLTNISLAHAQSRQQSCRGYDQEGEKKEITRSRHWYSREEGPRKLTERTGNPEDGRETKGWDGKPRGMGTKGDGKPRGGNRGRNGKPKGGTGTERWKPVEKGRPKKKTET
jgi:hypothetical protein